MFASLLRQLQDGEHGNVKQFFIQQNSSLPQDHVIDSTSEVRETRGQTDESYKKLDHQGTRNKHTHFTLNSLQKTSYYFTSGSKEGLSYSWILWLDQEGNEF